jgi:hypothetical protein
LQFPISSPNFVNLNETPKFYLQFRVHTFKNNQIKISPMKRIFTILLCLAILTAGVTSCKTGEGCPTKNYTAKVGKDGNISTKKGKSGLFPKGAKVH